MNYVSYIFEEITQIIDPAKIMMMTLFTFSTIFPFSFKMYQVMINDNLEFQITKIRVCKY